MPTLSDQTIAIVKGSAPALKDHGLTITRAMYARLFRDPKIRALFDQSHHGEDGSQPKALAAAILAYAENIDNLGALAPAVERIAQKHVSLQIQPAHYLSVAEALIGAIEEVLGAAATPELLNAWGEAYWFLADILKGREKQLYDETGSAPGGWSGWRGFRIEKRVKESEAITSFLLRPVDGGPVLRHRPGQYLTFLIDVPGKGPLKRTYTISCAPNGETYRISVKREPEGTVSQWLHDVAVEGTELKVAPPAGEFVLPDDPCRPLLLLSGGVGLTPMVSMLETVTRHYPGLEVHYVHGTIDGSTHAMGAHIRDLARHCSNLSATTFYSRPRAEDVAGRDYDQAGRIGIDWLRDNTPLGEADVFICGPIPFLRGFVSGLAEAGVPADRIHYEFFGPVDQLLEAWPEALDIVPAQTAPSPAAPSGAPSSGTGGASAEAAMAALLGSAAEALVVSDREGFITLWNPGAERIFGFTEADAMGQSLDIIIPESLRARHWEGYRETVESGQSRYGAGDLLSVPALHKEGHRLSVEFTIVLLKDEAGVVTGMVSVMRDATKRFEETKALRKKLAALEAGR